VCRAGSLKATRAERKSLAKQSLVHCCQSHKFRKMFPEYHERLQEQQKRAALEAATAVAPALGTDGAGAGQDHVVRDVSSAAAGCDDAPTRAVFASILTHIKNVLPSVLVVGLAVGVLCYQLWSQRSATM
jgi:hypothetical protein